MSGDDTQKPKSEAPVKPETPPPAANWQFKTDDAVDAAPASALPPAAPQASVRWSASEFIAHQKSATWYLVLFVSSIVAAGLVYLITRGDKITAGAIIVAAIFFSIVAARKPRVLDYEVSTSGVTVGRHFYPYSNFKSFSVRHDEAFSSISFMPLKRFMPFVTMYYSPDEEADIITMLSAFLPVEQAKRDMLDHFLERIRF
ncbi:MAG TPA: hypothetical protein VJR27_04965 [Candidatus Saccharimonadales bacterium]|nr:hypothetical protein [Candidatus Saccharimonadales bacterium]